MAATVGLAAGLADGSFVALAVGSTVGSATGAVPVRAECVHLASSEFSVVTIWSGQFAKDAEAAGARAANWSKRRG